MNRNYDKNYCWQYHIRLQNREEDMFFSGLTEETVKNLTVHDFDFNIVSTDSEKKQCIDFIKRHEGLGDISQAKSQKIEIGSKHKYAYVLGKDKKESKLLRRKFLELNKVYTPPKRNETFK